MDGGIDAGGQSGGDNGSAAEAVFEDNQDFPHTFQRQSSNRSTVSNASAPAHRRERSTPHRRPDGASASRDSTKQRGTSSGSPEGQSQSRRSAASSTGGKQASRREPSRPNERENQRLRAAQGPLAVEHSWAGGADGFLDCKGNSWSASIPHSARWAAPALVLLCGLFVQSAGLYLGTRCYVKVMDHVHQPLRNETAAIGSSVPQQAASGFLSRNHTNDGALDDAFMPGAAAVPSHAARHSSGGYSSLHAEKLTYVVDLTTNLVILVWFGWVARTRDLRLWTQTLLSWALLAGVKGFFAWCTILPDAEGWLGCQDRLGPDGLKYYRQASTGVEAPEIGWLEVVQDLLLLEALGLWNGGKGKRSRFCADTTLSSSVYLCVLFCASTYEVARLSSEQLQARTQLTVRVLSRCSFGIILLGNLLLPVVSRYHYSMDVLTAFILAFLVYTNPALAIAATRWAGPRQSPAVAALPLQPGLAQPLVEPQTQVADAAGSTAVRGGPAAGEHQHRRVRTPTDGSGAADASAGRASWREVATVQMADEAAARLHREEVGRLLVPVCSTSSSNEATLFLRSQPLRCSSLVETRSDEQCRQLQYQHYKEVQAQQIKHLRWCEELLRKERADLQLRAAWATAAAERSMQEALTTELRYLREEESRILAEKEEALRAEEEAADRGLPEAAVTTLMGTDSSANPVS